MSSIEIMVAIVCAIMGISLYIGSFNEVYSKHIPSVLRDQGLGQFAVGEYMFSKGVPRATQKMYIAAQLFTVIFVYTILHFGYRTGNVECMAFSGLGAAASTVGLILSLRRFLRPQT